MIAINKIFVIAVIQEPVTTELRTSMEFIVMIAAMIMKITAGTTRAPRTAKERSSIFRASQGLPLEVPARIDQVCAGNLRRKRVLICFAFLFSTFLLVLFSYCFTSLICIPGCDFVVRKQRGEKGDQEVEE